MSLITDTALETRTPLQARPAPMQAVRLSLEVVPGDVWDEVVAGFDGVCQEQLYLFARARWPQVRYEPIVFSSGGEVVGGTLIMIQPLPLRLGAIAVSKWGPMLKHTAHPQAAEIYAGMIDVLIEEYAQKRSMLVSILPRAALSDTNEEVAHLLERGFKVSSVLPFPNRYIVNLRLSDEEQRKSFEQKWRYHLRRSEKEDLVFEHAGPERLSEFDALYEAMTDRKKFPDHSAYDTVPALMATPIEALRPELFFVRQGGEVVAGAIIFKAGERAVYLYGATTDRALPLRAGYFLHWHIIGWLRDNTKADWYDLGGTDGFHGLHQFKKGMVGAQGRIQPVPPVLNYAAHILPRLFGEGAFFARDMVQRIRRVFETLRGDMARPDQVKSGSEKPAVDRTKNS